MEFRYEKGWTVFDIEAQNPGITLKRKSDVWEMRVFAFFNTLFGVLAYPFTGGKYVNQGTTFMTKFWTTWKRTPWASTVTICHPDAQDPLDYIHIIRHEYHHVQDMDGLLEWVWFTLLYTLLPLPILFSGRWFLEREAYLEDIQAGERTVEDVVATLHSAYLWPWPRKLMRRWFEKHLS